MNELSRERPFLPRRPALLAGVAVVLGCVLAHWIAPGRADVWLIIGGVVYTLGAVVYATKMFNFVPGVFGFHEVWHIFVLLAAAAHFVAVMGVAL